MAIKDLLQNLLARFPELHYAIPSFGLILGLTGLVIFAADDEQIARRPGVRPDEVVGVFRIPVEARTEGTRRKIDSDARFQWRYLL